MSVLVIATGFEVKTQFESTLPQTQAAPQPVIAHNPYNQNPPASNNGMGFQGNNSPYGQTTNPYGVNQQTASKVIQPNLFNTPPAQPSVVNHVPSAFDQDSQDELGKTVHQNSDWDQSEALNPINVSPKAFEPSADEWNEDPMSQIFRDTEVV